MYTTWCETQLKTIAMLKRGPIQIGVDLNSSKVCVCGFYMYSCQVMSFAQSIDLRDAIHY